MNQFIKHHTIQHGVSDSENIETRAIYGIAAVEKIAKALLDEYMFPQRRICAQP